MLKDTKIDGMKNIGYDDCRGRDAFHIPEDAFRGSNRLLFQILSCFPYFDPISLSREHHLLEVQPIVFQLPPR
jgi:hypothetical protein